ncbi:hypothetical protein HY310_03785 [Candidatus Microgenomates bacterium]|nr:hypothetical protein [Candidatus Microgenomates bacterium]
MGNAQILFGASGIKQAYKDLLTSKNLDIVCLSSNYSAVIGTFFDQEYAPKLFGSEITTREILPDTSGNRNDAKTKDQVKNQVKFLTDAKSESDIILSEDKAVLVSYDLEAPFALVVSDKELVKSLKAQFEALWRSL